MILTVSEQGTKQLRLCEDHFCYLWWRTSWTFDTLKTIMLIYFVCEMLCTHLGGDQRTTWGRQFFSSIMWVSGIELGEHSINWAISPASITISTCCHFICPTHGFNWWIFASVCVFNMWPKTILHPMQPRETKRQCFFEHDMKKKKKNSCKFNKRQINLGLGRWLSKPDNPSFISGSHIRSWMWWYTPVIQHCYGEREADIRESVGSLWGCYPGVHTTAAETRENLLQHEEAKNQLLKLSCPLCVLPVACTHSSTYPIPPPTIHIVN